MIDDISMFASLFYICNEMLQLQVCQLHCCRAADHCCSWEWRF